MATIVDGNIIAETILNNLKTRVAALKEKGVNPTLAVVLVGNDKASKMYIAKKQAAAVALGMTFLSFEFPENISQTALIVNLQKIQAENKLSGLIVQLPLPDDLWANTRDIMDYIGLSIDVDCLSHTALGRVLMGEHFLIPPTPGAIMEILNQHKIDLTGKEVCLVGRGELIGKPLAGIFLSQPVTLKVCGKATKDLAKETKTADIIITGVGKKNILTGEMIKDGAVVIDAGICFDENNKICGDIDFNSITIKASLVTPVVGGVGPITVAKLLENTIRAAERQLGG